MCLCSRNPVCAAGLLLVLTISPGCGGGNESAGGSGVAGTTEEIAAGGAASAESQETGRGNQAAGLVTAAIKSPAAAEQKSAAVQTPEDEVSRLLREAQQLRIAPVTGAADEERKVRRSRNEQIVELATKVLTLTMNDKAREPQFNQAVGQLLEARFQMALAGTKDDAEQFYADVQALNDRDPKSAAAAEGVYRIARFVHTKAGLLGKTQPVWFEELSRCARDFAERFPEYGQRNGQISPAVTLLFGAARSCELHALTAEDKDLATRLMTEARLCYTAMARDFAKTPQGQEAAAVLRRMSLAGQQLSQFKGPTLDGGMVTAEDFPGKPTLIYFWTSDESEFVTELLPILKKVKAQVSTDRLRIVGVAMDENEAELEAFMEKHEVPGQQIFFTGAEQRSWNSPLVRFWGISQSPSVWLVDRNGIVTSTSVRPDELTKMLSQLLK